MIYIGQIMGGPEFHDDAPINMALAKIYRLRGPVGEGEFGSLDVVFHVAGSILEPEFVGVRAGRFSRKRRMLQVQIAVPSEVVAGENPYPIPRGAGPRSCPPRSSRLREGQDSISRGAVRCYRRNHDEGGHSLKSGRSNKELKLTKRGKLRSFAA
jgi:hypothetical protein